MCQFSRTVLHAREKCIKKQTEINLSGHFLHSRFELTCSEISQGRDEGNQKDPERRGGEMAFILQFAGCTVTGRQECLAGVTL